MKFPSLKDKNIEILTGGRRVGNDFIEYEGTQPVYIRKNIFEGREKNYYKKRKMFHKRVGNDIHIYKDNTIAVIEDYFQPKSKQKRKSNAISNTLDIKPFVDLTTENNTNIDETDVEICRRVGNDFFFPNGEVVKNYYEGKEDYYKKHNIPHKRVGDDNYNLEYGCKVIVLDYYKYKNRKAKKNDRYPPTPKKKRQIQRNKIPGNLEFRLIMATFFILMKN